MLSATAIKSKKIKHSEIPTALIYEIIDGKPIYFNGYKDVLSGEKTIEDIMATGVRQSLMINIIRDRITQSPQYKNMSVMNGEIGIHITKNLNFSCDIVVWDNAQLATLDNTNNYFTIPPKIIVEVDTNADLSEINFNHYMLKKTERLLNFGVEKIIWIFSEYQKVMFARPNQDWITRDWDKAIDILDGDSVILSELFKSKGLVFQPV
jgi:hypothetical protein